MTARVAIAVRPASLIATPSGSVGDEGGTFGKRQAKNSTKAIHGRNTSGMPVRNTSAPCSARAADSSGDQRVAQHEVGERAGANELLHRPQQPFIERRVAQLVSTGEMALQKLGGERVLQGPSGGHRPKHQHEGRAPQQPEGRHPSGRQDLPGKLRRQPLVRRRAFIHGGRQASRACL
jgi:hypothetical protein